MKRRYLILAFPLFSMLQVTAQDNKTLHDRAIVVDTHNDFPSVSIEMGLRFENNLKGQAHTDLQRLRSGGVDLQIFSVWCGPEQKKPYAWANREIDSVHRWVKNNPATLSFVGHPGDFDKAQASGKTGIMIGVEGGHMLEEDPSKVDSLFQRGVRYLTLTWNNSTSWASAAADETNPKKKLAHYGLTEKGKKILQRMNDLGMLIDVSHVGEKTFSDVMATSTKPVIASHSSVYRLCPHRRNLKDDQIRAIAKNQGVIHINFYAGFIDSLYEKRMAGFLKKHQSELDKLIASGAQAEYAAMSIAGRYPKEVNAFRPSLNQLIDHIDYIVRLVGADYVGLGSDFDGIEAPPRGLEGVEDFPAITKALQERGYSEGDILKILGGNFLRVFKANMQ